MLNAFVTTEITKLVIAIALIVLSAAASYAVVIARKHLSPAQIDVVVEIARIATLGVEQLSAALGLNGPAKYASALTRAMALASRYGITLTADEWQSYIEAGVRMLKAAGEELIATPSPLVLPASAPPTPFDAVPLGSGAHA